MAFYGSSRKWSDSTWTHGKQLEQLLQQVTTLRGDIASSRPMQTKGRLYGNNGFIPSSIKSFAIAGVLYPASAIIVSISEFFILS